MHSDKLKVLMVCAEAAPYASEGGVSQVIRQLTQSLTDLGHDVRVFIPKFGSIDEEKFGIKMLYEGLQVPTDDENTPFLSCNVKVKEDSEGTGVTVYFLENQEYYEKRANVYGYSDDSTRFALLSRGALEFIRTKIFIPDVIHSHDWHTGVLPNYIKTVYSKDPILSKITTVFTIHNLAYQGPIDYRYVSEMDYDDGKSLVVSLFSERLNKQHFLKRGIIYSDVINTVSKTYSREILTEEFGVGLDKLLLELKGKLFGITNGIDYEQFDPETDTLIEQNYNVDSVDLRANNKPALQKEFDLPVRDDVFILGYSNRLDQQKGVDLIISTLEVLLKDYDVQFVQNGGGDGWLAERLRELKDKFPDKVGIHPYPNFTLPRMIFSGADAMMFPSRFEPCGITHFEAMRYGAVPIVRKVGGMADTVQNFDSAKGEGTGFVFKDFDEFALYGQIVRAYEIFQNKPLWRMLQVNAMEADYSWSYSAKEYIRLYERAMILGDEKNPLNKRMEAALSNQ